MTKAISRFQRQKYKPSAIDEGSNEVRGLTVPSVPPRGRPTAGAEDSGAVAEGQLVPPVPKPLPAQQTTSGTSTGQPSKVTEPTDTQGGKSENE